jgi:hypothetical protein
VASRPDSFEDRQDAVAAELGRVVIALDELWRDAVDAGTTDAAISLGDASHSVHRAVIALVRHRACPVSGARNR